MDLEDEVLTKTESFSTKIKILDGESKLYYFPQYFSAHLELMNLIGPKLAFRSDKIKMFGKVYEQPRKVAWYGDPGIRYTYSGIPLQAKGWIDELQLIRKSLFKLGHQFNTCLVNLYRDGSDSMSWHRDNEPELGGMPWIASLSLGAKRKFKLKSNCNDQVIDLMLGEGDLLLMGGSLQDQYQHCLPKTKKNVGARMNLTYRRVLI